MESQMIEKVRCDGETETLKLDDSLTEIIIPRSTSLYLNLYSSHVPAGFPSPAESYVERTLDLNEYLISNRAATFFVRVSGDSMIGAGIHSNDILIVDRSREVKDNNIIIAAINGELTVKRLKNRSGEISLVPENEAYPELLITGDMEFMVWGVVTSVIHQF